MLGLAYEGTQKGCGSFLSPNPAPAPHCCLKVKRLLLGEKESLRGIGTHRYISNLLHTSLCLLTGLWPKKHKAGPCEMSGVEGGGAGREAEREASDPLPGPSVSTQSTTWERSETQLCQGSAG